MNACSRAANPMSDEEGEDLVRECDRVVEKALCKTVYAVAVSTSQQIVFVPCDRVTDEEHIAICARSTR